MSIRHRVFALTGAASIVLAPALAAQSPVVTPKGDPSVRADSIYRLASTPEANPDLQSLVLLDDGIVRLEPDGRATSTYRQIIQALTEDAVENMQEQSISWVPGRQQIRINWLRVVRPDGTVISAEPAQVQDSDVPAELRDPVYSDRRVRRMSLAGVAIGTIVDFSFTIIDTKPYPPNDHYATWSVSMGSPVKRSRLILDVPTNLAPTIVETNLNFKRSESVAKGRRVYTWAAADVPRVKPEQYAADSNDVYMHLAYALPRTWADVGRWYGAASKDRYTLGETARARIAEAVRGAASREDSLRLLHKLVAQDIRYVSVSLGNGGYVPRLPEEVVTTGFGDCKDKATLFVAALRSWGIRAHPVILRTATVDRRLPSLLQFNHAIAAIETADGYRYTDLTAAFTPWGELPYGPQGEFALVVRDDDRVDEVTIPREPVESNRSWVHIAGALDTAGVFSGWYEQGASGIEQGRLRDALSAPLDSTRRDEVTRGLATSIYPTMTGDSLAVFVGKDLQATPRIALRVRGGRAATKAGPSIILSLPLGNMESMAAHADQLETEPRRFTINAEAVAGPTLRETVIRMTLPAGWKAQLPAGVRATSPFGEFHAIYEQNGRELVITRRTVGARGVYAPSRLPELTAWLRAMAKEDTRFIAISTN
ncbi:MAG TPA: DUF3857 domain-containing transglutaminase family protein [Gemmatimonadaceae bacterium]|nr:DUF3857 domain-containing transglutaminase family protein [Gemmatimonadaceae bacterium]